MEFMVKEKEKYSKKNLKTSKTKCHINGKQINK